MQLVVYIQLTSNCFARVDVIVYSIIFSQWTYILASVLVISSSVYCYFQTTSLKQSTYAPVILTGSGMSIMYVMALAFIAELIGDDKVRFTTA